MAFIYPRPGSRIQQGQRQVYQAVHAATEVLDARANIQEAINKVSTSRLHAWPVDESGVIGMVSLSRLQKALTEGATTKRLSEILEAGEFPHVHMDHALAIALDRMDTSQLDVLPVVNRANVHKLEGIVTLQDVLRLYGVGLRETTVASGESAPTSPPAVTGLRAVQNCDRPRTRLHRHRQIHPPKIRRPQNQNHRSSEAQKPLRCSRATTCY
jgi:CBS domain-containing protein